MNETVTKPAAASFDVGADSRGEFAMPAPSKVAEKDGSGRRTAALSIVCIAALLAVGWALDVWLLLRLRMIAHEVFADPTYPMLLVDAAEELDGYPPNRLSDHLDSSQQIATVVCLSLARHRTKRPEQWDGVLPKLIDAFNRAVGRVDRSAAMNALRMVPRVAPDDVDAVFAFAEERMKSGDLSWTIAAELVHKAATSNPNQSSRALDFYLSSVERMGETTRRETLQHMLWVGPKSPQAAEAVRIASLTAPVDLFVDASILKLMQQQPALIDELLEGSRNQRALALSLLARERYSLRDDAARRQWLTDDRLERMFRAAAEFVTTTDVDPTIEDRVGFGVYGLAPQGPERLFEVARRTSGERRTLAIMEALSGVNRRSVADREQFIEPRLKDLLAFLDEDDADRQHNILWYLWYCPMGGRIRNYPSAPENPIVEACRRMLDRHPNRQDFICLSFLAESAPRIDDRDADRIAAALERALMDFRRNQEGTVLRTHGDLAPVHVQLFHRLKRHADRPAVRKVLDLRAKMEADGLIDVSREGRRDHGR